MPASTDVPAYDLTDPEELLKLREDFAVRNMRALMSIAENGKDERARVAASKELNVMLSIGTVNRNRLSNVTQVNNLRLSKAASDDATQKLLDRFGGEAPVRTPEAHVIEHLDALEYEEGEG